MQLTGLPTATRGATHAYRACKQACKPNVRAHAAAPSSTVPPTAARTPEQRACVWQQFSEKASGEWEGVTASFGVPTGEPLPLDPYYVPQAFRDWGVELYDWQTTCSTLAQQDTQGSLNHISRSMMPTVGCEADAVAFTEEAGAMKGALLAVSPEGSYVAGPPQLDTEDGRARVEFCVPLTASSSTATEQQPQRERVRVVHHMQVNWQSKQWELCRVEMHRERYDKPYTGQIDLCGCGGGMPTFAKTETTSEERAQVAVSGKLSDLWSYEVDNDESLQLSQQAPPPSSLQAMQGNQEMTRMLLPLGVILYNRVGGVEGNVDLQLAVANGDKESRVAVCSYVDGRMRQAAMGQSVA